MNHRLKVVLTDHCVGGSALKAGQSTQNLGRRIAAAGDRDVGQGVQGVELILRGLQDDGIRHAIGGIEPETRRHLTAAGEVDHQTVGHIARRQTDFLSPGPIQIHFEHRAGPGLLNSDIGDPGNLS